MNLEAAIQKRDGKAIRAAVKAGEVAGYTAAQFARFDDALLDELCELGERALGILVDVARGLEAAKLPIASTKDFKVLVFDHDDEEKQALARR